VHFALNQWFKSASTATALSDRYQPNLKSEMVRGDGMSCLMIRRNQSLLVGIFGRGSYVSPNVGHPRAIVKHFGACPARPKKARKVLALAAPCYLNYGHPPEPSGEGRKAAKEQS